MGDEISRLFNGLFGNETEGARAPVQSIASAAEAVLPRVDPLNPDGKTVNRAALLATAGKNKGTLTSNSGKRRFLGV